MRFGRKQGANVYLNLEPETREEADRLFNSLAEGGQIEMPIQDMFWGAYFGSLIGRAGIQWMVNCMTPACAFRQSGSDAARRAGSRA